MAHAELYHIKPRFSTSCVKSFEDFIQFANAGVGMSDDEQRAWYARMKLRFSCSSLAVGFQRLLIPEL